MPNGRCRMHGGSTPIKHGRYSKTTRPRIAELLREFNEDPEPLDLLQDVLMLRALAFDFVERYDEFTDALIAWNRSFATGEKTKPVRVLDIADAGSLLDRAGRMVERIEKFKAENAVSQKDLGRVLEEYARVMRHHVQDPAIREKIGRDWLAIRV